MNQQRKTVIEEITTRLRCCADDLDDVKNEEDFARESIPPNLQSGETYSTSEDCSDKISDAVSDIWQAISTLEEI